MTQRTQLLTTGQIAKRWGCKPANVQRYIRDGRLTVAAVVGNGIRLINPDEADKLGEKRSQRTLARVVALK